MNYLFLSTAIFVPNVLIIFHVFKVTCFHFEYQVHLDDYDIGNLLLIAFSKIIVSLILYIICITVCHEIPLFPK